MDTTPSSSLNHNNKPRMPSSSSRCLLLLLLAAPSQGVRPDSWYRKYPHYHPYCSTSMSDRAVPPLVDQRASKLLHVSAVIRHGARTPWNAHENCWEGYLDPKADTAVWDCGLTTLTAPPTPNGIEREEGDPQAYDGSDTSMFLFEKHYTALQNPEVGLKNSLGGTCELGQLLLQGYEQELANGKHLREAYIYSSEDNVTRLSHLHDFRTQLLDVDEPLWQEDGQIYFRADDDQRTLMSGQVLLRGMLGPELEQHRIEHNEFPILPLRVGDRARDILDANERVCPRLAEIKATYSQSAEFQAFDQGAEALALRGFMRDVLKIDGDMNAIDCLMTTMCTDRQLPDALNDYDPQTMGMFEKLFNWQVRDHTMVYLANNAEYAKLAMQPLWSELMEIIRSVRDTKIFDVANMGRQPWPKLALYSGHDTTLMPLLATLGPRVWDQTWSPYASMMLVEVHGILDDKNTIVSQAFRLVYNGKSITSRVPGCPDDTDLCDLDVLIDIVEPFSDANQWDCTPRDPNFVNPATIATTTTANVEPRGSTGQRAAAGRANVFENILLVLGSAALGAGVAYMEMKRRGQLVGLGSGTNLREADFPNSNGNNHNNNDESKNLQLSDLPVSDQRDEIIHRIWGLSGRASLATPDREHWKKNLTDVPIEGGDDDTERDEDIITRILA